MQTDLVIIREYCRNCEIEPAFLELLQEGGLIDIYREGEEAYLFVSQLPVVERYSRMYYDLSINMEGIEAIHHMLQRIEALQQELNELRDRLLFFEKR